MNKVSKGIYAGAVLFSLTIILLSGAVLHLLRVNSLLQSKLHAQRIFLSDGESSFPPVEEIIPMNPPQNDNRVLLNEPLDISWRPTLGEELQGCEGSQEDCGTKRFLAGEIKNEELFGKKFYLEVIGGLGREFNYYYVDDAGESIYFDTYSSDFRLIGVTDLPEFVDLPGTGYQLKKYYRSILFSDARIVKKWFTHPTLGDFYLTEEGCLVVELPDHTAMAYDLVIPFASKELGTVDITFHTGEKNIETYIFNEFYGCGALCYYLARVEESVLQPETRLVSVGKTMSGEDVYGLKDSKDSALVALYEDENTVAYVTDNWERTPESKYTYDEFIARRPLLYWKDPLGRWIELRNHRFITAAEMCKPVIYLYPEEKTNLHVTVQPNGGFTYTNPRYEDGWQVEANPDGRIKDLKTGKTHDYLFWEGIGLNYPMQDAGWVVRREDLRSFFDRVLPQLGMQGKEISDFQDYWIQRLSEKPYYQLSFLKKEQFDEIAPLGIGPVKPRTVIRVLLTAKGLDTAKIIPAQELPETPKRSGFTVVEWGGVVLK